MLQIKKIIKEKGFTVTSFAKKIGISQVSLSRIINGNPTIETLQKIADTLEVPVKELFDDDSETSQTLYVKKEGDYIPIGAIKRTIK